MFAVFRKVFPFFPFVLRRQGIGAADAPQGFHVVPELVPEDPPQDPPGFLRVRVGMRPEKGAPVHDDLPYAGDRKSVV